MDTRRIPNSLKLYRRKQGLKQTDVARILGVKSAAMISRWEKGQTFPSTLNVFKLALIYRTMTDALYMDYLTVLKAEIRTSEEELIG
jgi:transcriptional regulator with XRE-family HTH domain